MMKKIINYRKYIVITLLLSLFFRAESSAQLPVDKQWEKRMRELIPVIKERISEMFVIYGPDWFIDAGLTQEDFMDAPCFPYATLVLDYRSFSGLTPKSKLEELIKLDTTHFDCDVFSKKKSQYLSGFRAIVLEGRWLSNGVGINTDPHYIDFITRIHNENISYHRLRVQYNPGNEVGKAFFFYVENGRLVTPWGAIEKGVTRPLIDVLLEYLEEIKYEEALYQGVLNPPLPASYRRYEQKLLEMQKK